jgi:prepilin-type N-terminal cleavage/methylation domain-containing protein
MKNSGFTLLEILLVLTVFAILLVISFAAFGSFRDDSALGNEATNIQAILRLAQSRTVASESDTRYGVYFDTGTSPHQYVLFQTDTDYAARAVPEDEIYQVSNAVQFSSVTFSNLSGQEVVFDRIQGTTDNNGNVVLQSTMNAGKTRTVWVSGTGTIELSAGSAPSDADRIKDSRHMHVTYSGEEVETADEVIHLTFASPPNPDITYDIVIANYLSGGQIDWSGDIDVYGDTQALKIHTHKLNDVGFTTEFSIHRDRRFNTKALTVELDGGIVEDTGTLVEYDTSGIVTLGTSIHVSSTQQQ